MNKPAGKFCFAAARARCALCAALLCGCLCLGLAGCGASLPEGVTQDDVTQAAAATVAALNSRDYDALTASMNETMTAALDKEKLAAAWEPFSEKMGAFSSIAKTRVGASKGYAVAVVTADYAAGTVTFTLSYDADLKLAGLYFK